MSCRHAASSPSSSTPWWSSESGRAFGRAVFIGRDHGPCWYFVIWIWRLAPSDEAMLAAMQRTGIMRRLLWHEMVRYWETHAARCGPRDYELDPDALDNVCHSGEPLWLNQYYARYQRYVYQHMLKFVPAPGVGARALDIGCGGGRWCRLLSQRGFKTTGIDLQETLIDHNRRTIPDCTFVCASVQDFETEDLFDLLSSVTVVQHVPFEEQQVVLSKLRSLSHVGAYGIFLENVRDQDFHMFANSIEEWCKKFTAAGFTTLALHRYDYSPSLRLFKRLASV